jgi:hypothetical protein
MADTKGHSALNMADKGRWVGHLCGFVAALFIAHLTIASLVHSFPVPHVSGTTFIAMYLGAIVLSLAAGLKASRWWFMVTVLLVAMILLIWAAEAFFERR